MTTRVSKSNSLQESYAAAGSYTPINAVTLALPQVYPPDYAPSFPIALIMLKALSYHRLPSSLSIILSMTNKIPDSAHQRF